MSEALELTQEEKDERLAQEEARIAKRLASKGGGAPELTPEQVEHQRRVEQGSTKVTVQLVNSHNHNTVLEQGEYALSKGRIPIHDISSKWRGEDTRWGGIEMEIGKEEGGEQENTFPTLKERKNFWKSSGGGG
eukprot:TRINITY_DN42_c0_g1_i1.p2 TRINITY_DN42_c0_g1~~TRINITY_DN42_c0_g1_i1.p2  ORF type:complete len:134 (-),score=11.73 TRINITY_DN42_c0_g1_i1:78-479(-)